MANSDYDALRLDNQVCFPLYAAAREVTKLYRPYLDELNLTYTQYITMMVLWEQRSCSAKQLGEKLYLDSGTLTPVIKSLEQKGFVVRSRSSSDERVLMVGLTDKGLALREEAKTIPQKMSACVKLTPEEAVTLYKLIYKVLGDGE